MRYIGIDVGKKGGVACIDEKGDLHLHRIPMIGNEVDLSSLFSIISSLTGFGDSRKQHIVCVEDVHSISGSSAKSNFSFGENKGQLEGLLVGMQASYQKVSPKTWQKICWEGVAIQKKPDGKTDTKSMSLIAAKRLFPTESFLISNRDNAVPHDGLVDAALIAKYAQIKYK